MERITRPSGWSARWAGCLLLAASCFVSACLAELGLRALGYRPLAVRQDWTTFWDGTRMRLPGDGHWNRDGHTFVAARVIEHIERHELLDDP